MIGQKGLPATFGGIEHHVEEVGARLASRGHEVTVYCRTTYRSVTEETYRGMRLVLLPTIDSKHLDAIAHSALATVSALRRSPDIVHYHALGPGLVAPLPRLFGPARVVLTVHGLDQQRAKWGLAARGILEMAHWMSARVPDATVVVSEALARHYRERFDRRTFYVPNGIDGQPFTAPNGTLQGYGLEPGSYLLFVGRLVPEKAPDLLVRAFRRVQTDRCLVIAGGSSFSDSYAAELRDLAGGDPRVRFTGYVYGDALRELYSNARAFVLPSVVEGMPLTILEAISHGLPVIASDIEPHREVLGGTGPGRRLFRAGDEASLERALEWGVSFDSADRLGACELQRKTLARYPWEFTASRLEAIYLRVARPNRPLPRP